MTKCYSGAVSALVVALAFCSGCAMNIYNSQRVQDGNGAGTSTGTSHDSRADGSSRTKQVTHVRRTASQKKKTSKERKTPSSGNVISERTATKVKINSSGDTNKERTKPGRNTGLLGHAVDRNKGQGSTRVRTRETASDLSKRNREKVNSQQLKPRKPSIPKVLGKQARITTEQTVLQTPPEEPSDNEFGYEQPIAGCFKGEVVFIEPNSRKLPDHFSSYDVASVLYACEWDIPQRSFDKGFPGVENQFEWFAIRYGGAFTVSRTGTYTFRLNSDDGARLYIDQKLVVDNDGVHAESSRQGTIELCAGQHEMILEYFQGPRYHIALQLYVTPPDEAERIFTVR